MDLLEQYKSKLDIKERGDTTPSLAEEWFTHFRYDESDRMEVIPVIEATYNVSRQTTPIFEMGSPNIRNYIDTGRRTINLTMTTEYNIVDVRDIRSITIRGVTLDYPMLVDMRTTMDNDEVKYYYHFMSN